MGKRWALDVTDLGSLPDAAFDAATAYGGPLSYVFDRAEVATDELLRVVRPGGMVLLSVMSRWGTVRAFLEGVLLLDVRGREAESDAVLATGDLIGKLAPQAPGISVPHECHMFTWAELRDLLAARAEIVDASAANFLSVRNEELLIGLSDERWQRFLDWEENACRSDGALEGGTHILVAIRKRA